MHLEYVNIRKGTPLIFLKVEFWIERMKSNGLKPDVATYNSLMTWMLRKGDEEGAKNLEEEMRIEGVRQGVSIFNSKIRQAVRENDTTKIDELVKEMKDTNVRPNIVTFICLVGEEVKRGAKGRVQNWYTRMRKAGVSEEKMRSTLTDLLQRAGDNHGLAYWVKD